jgi:integrase
MISGSWLTEEEKDEYEKANRKIGYARSTINKHIGRIKLLFGWATEQELIPSSVLHGLQAVRGLRRGRSGARETEDVKPVAIGIVETTMPYLPPVVKDIVQLLLLSGMRVGEATIIRACDIDMTGDVWLFRPERHKNLHRGHERVIALGPQAKDLVRKYLKPKIEAYLFSPAEQDAIIAAEKRALRKTKVQPSQKCRKKARPQHKPGEQFDHNSVNRAIRRACKRAGVPTWHTHQLRHTAALEITRQHGLEAARAVLGHKCVSMSAHYAGIDQARAAEVMSRIG